MKSKITVGSKVKYKVSFLRSIGCYTGDMPFARGIVTDIKPLSRETILASVDWNNDSPDRVNVSNLTFISDPETKDI
jgi:hypothetical protein